MTPIRETIARVYVETANGRPDPEWAEHWQWYLDGAGNPNSCVHYSVHGRGAQHADRILRALDEAGLVVVPKEPSEAMQVAGAIHYIPRIGAAGLRASDAHPVTAATYRAMIAAVKEPE